MVQMCRCYFTRQPTFTERNQEINKCVRPTLWFWVGRGCGIPPGNLSTGTLPPQYSTILRYPTPRYLTLQIPYPQISYPQIPYPPIPYPQIFYPPDILPPHSFSPEYLFPAYTLSPRYPTLQVPYPVDTLPLIPYLMFSLLRMRLFSFVRFILSCLSAQ